MNCLSKVFSNVQTHDLENPANCSSGVILHPNFIESLSQRPASD
jgi:hypothetical protein